MKCGDSSRSLNCLHNLSRGDVPKIKDAGQEIKGSSSPGVRQNESKEVESEALSSEKLKGAGKILNESEYLWGGGGERKKIEDRKYQDWSEQKKEAAINEVDQVIKRDTGKDGRKTRENSWKTWSDWEFYPFIAATQWVEQYANTTQSFCSLKKLIQFSLHAVCNG